MWVINMKTMYPWMRIDYVTGKYVLIIASVIRLGYIRKNVHVRYCTYWCYYGKVRTSYLNVIT